MMGIPFDRSFEAPYGEMQQLSPMVSRLLARNPSPFTFKGTGVYFIGANKHARDIAIIDPGPLIPEHLKALKRAIDGKRVTHILVTHTHTDHSPAARPLKEWTGATTYGFGPHGSGKDDSVKIEEGGDRDFVPDVTVRNGDVIAGNGFTFDCVYTPGHTSNHMCYSLRKLLARDDQILYPTHGAPVRDPNPFIQAYLDHRLERERQILACLRAGANTIS